MRSGHYLAPRSALAMMLAWAICSWPTGANAQQKKEPPAAELKTDGARLIVYHKCLNLTLMTGIKVPAADHYMWVAGKNVGASPLCSVRSFKVVPGEHVVEVKDWSGIIPSFVERKARFTAGQTVHVLVEKGSGGSAFWSLISPTQARDLAREIANANKN